MFDWIEDWFQPLPFAQELQRWACVGFVLLLVLPPLLGYIIAELLPIPEDDIDGEG